MNISKIVIITSEREKSKQLTQEIETHLVSLGIEVFYFHVPYNSLVEPVLPDKPIDIAIAVGGDGTALRAARVCAYRDIPIFPIKMGHFGFINEIQVEEWKESFEELLNDTARIGSYPLLETVLENQSWLAFNDITVTSESYGAISVNLYMHDELITRYRADGVIVATPMGSTGHSLSAGGPIVAPNLHACIVNPIAPFTLSNRSIVLPIDNPLVFEIEQGQRHEAVLVVDGCVILGLLPGCRYRVRNSKVKAYIVHSSKRSYFDILRDKLGWRGEFRA